jgi:hypothetical protein
VIEQASSTTHKNKQMARLCGMGGCNKKEVPKRCDRTLLLEKMKRDKGCKDSEAGKQVL